MSTTRITRNAAVAIAVGTGLAIAGVAPAQAQEPIHLPAGLACPFALDLVGFEETQPDLTFHDKSGNVVREFRVGTGQALTFVNAETGESLSTKANGAVQKTTYRPDGTRRVVSTGHNVLIMFPSDSPAGPSTTLYVGKIVYDATPDNTFTLLSTSGRSVDICAALS